MFRRIVTAVALLAVAAVPSLSGAIGNGTGFKTGSCELGSAIAPGSSGVVHKVGADREFTTIGAAVAAAAEGDHIVIYPGIYTEQVKVTTPGLRITGTDRDGVVLDGGATLTARGKQFGFLVTADRVLIENMTAHGYQHTAFFWLSATGYWGRYLTAYNNGLYGLYAYDSRCGQMDNSFASGHPDSAFYIGECYPCDAVITNVDAFENALGYSGTNAGGNLLLKDSWWHENGLGIVPNSLDGEVAPPQRGTTIENNLIEDNSRKDVPGSGLAGTFYGAGIVIAGGSANQVIGNTVRNHTYSGISLVPLPDTFVYVPTGNIIWGNTVSGSGIADLAQGAGSGPGNCWDHNTYQSTAPPLILETVWGCTNSDTDPPKLPFYSGITPPGGDPRVEEILIEGAAGLNGRAAKPWQTWAAPTCASSPSSCQDLPDENGDSSYVNDAEADIWLHALL